MVCLRIGLFVVLVLLGAISLVFAQTILAQSGEYKLVRPGKYCSAIQVLRGDAVIYEVRSEYVKEISQKSGFGEEETCVDLIYSGLASRGSLAMQPRPFDDVNGDGAPDIVFMERGHVSNASVHYRALRMVSLKDGKAEEATAFFDLFGEMIHFDDFNKDGVLELVNTDAERDFKYSPDGLPKSSMVIVFDKMERQYRHLSD